MNAFTEQQQQQQQETDKSKSKSSPTIKHSKTKQSHNSASPDVPNGKKHENSRRSSSSRSKTSSNPSNLSSTTNNDSTMLDPLAFAAAAAAAAASGGLTFPYFLPSLLSQTSSTTGTNNNPSTYPFSSLTNPTAGLYPFLSPDWFTSTPSIGNLTPGKHNQFNLIIIDICLFYFKDSKPSKKRSKSIRTLTEEQDKNSSSILHSALVCLNLFSSTKKRFLSI